MTSVEINHQGRLDDQNDNHPPKCKCDDPRHDCSDESIRDPYTDPDVTRQYESRSLNRDGNQNGTIPASKISPISADGIRVRFFMFFSNQGLGGYTTGCEPEFN
jgi:hypothetical protein